MGPGPDQPFYYSFHLLRGRDISAHVLLLHHQDRVLPRSFHHRSRSSRSADMTSLLRRSCRDRLSHFAGSSVISRARSTLSVSVWPEDYTHLYQDVYLSQHRFSRERRVRPWPTGQGRGHGHQRRQGSGRLAVRRWP